MQRVRVRLLRQHAEGLERQLPVRELGRLQQRVEVEGVEQHGLGCRQPAQLVERPVAQPQAQQGEAARARVGTLEGGFREERVEALARGQGLLEVGRAVAGANRGAVLESE